MILIIIHHVKALVALSARFIATPDGRLWTREAPLIHRFWTRYLDVFQEVTIVARALSMPEPPDGSYESTGEAVSAFPLPHYVGPAGYVRSLPAARTRLKALDFGKAALFLRVPLARAGLILSHRKPNQPYGVEVVGDPWDSLAPGAIRHPLRPVLRRVLRRRLRREVAGAAAAAYVTRDALQSRYPSGPSAPTFHFASVVLTEESFAQKPRTEPGKVAHLVTVGTLDQLYKGPEVLLRVLVAMRSRGISFRHLWVGDGKYRARMESLARNLGLADRVCFGGAMDREKLLSVLDTSDVFILPSYQEGLPRALLEAMARGLPCAATSVGGVAELLPHQFLAPPGDSQRLAEVVETLLVSRQTYSESSRRNLTKAREYEDSALGVRRGAFYSHIRDTTRQWRKADFGSLGEA